MFSITLNVIWLMGSQSILYSDHPRSNLSCNKKACKVFFFSCLVKLAISLFNSFYSNVAKQVVRFLFPVLASESTLADWSLVSLKATKTEVFFYTWEIPEVWFETSICLFLASVQVFSTYLLIIHCSLNQLWAICRVNEVEVWSWLRKLPGKNL